MPKRLLVTAVMISLIEVVSLLQVPPVTALMLKNRSIAISTATPGAIANHTLSFSPQSASNLGSIVIEYCDSPVFEYSCVPPPSLDTSTAVLVNQSGNVGFSIDGANSTSNKIVLTRPVAIAATVASSYQFSNITNPNVSNTSTYVRISTYASTDGSGALTDSGAVAFSTVSQFSVSTVVPPFLNLCVAVTVSLNCKSAVGDSLNLGILSASSAKSGTTEFAVGTNSDTGYVVYVIGTTMTSGNNIIPAMSSSTTSHPGVSQFGMNLVANNNPNIGQNIQGSGSGSPLPGYGTPDNFKFNNGDSIFTSDLPTEYNKVTASYITNISTAQAPGVYNTTLTYLAAAQF
jgi:hypothetical protein